MKDTTKDKINKAKEKEKLKKEIKKIKDKNIKKEIVKITPISEFTEKIDNSNIITEIDSLILKIKEKEDTFLLTYFSEIIKPTKVFIYNHDKSFIEYKIEDIIILSKEKPIVKNNNTNTQIIKLKKYFETILCVENIYITFNYNENVKLKYKYTNIKNNKFMSFEKMKKSDFKY